MSCAPLYRDASRVRHMLDALRQISELSKGLAREQMGLHEGVSERILFNLVILGEAANHISREYADKHPDVDWRGIAGIRHSRQWFHISFTDSTWYQTMIV